MCVCQARESAQDNRARQLEREKKEQQQKKDQIEVRATGVACVN